MNELPDIRKLVLILTARCNLNCSYCYQNRKQNRCMEFETLKASIDLALKSRHHDVELIFSGGEPLLELDTIYGGVDYANKIGPSNKRLTYTLITNGLLLTEDLLDFMAAHDFQLQLSFDGIASAQNFRSPGTFSTLDRLLITLCESYYEYFTRKVRISVTATPAAVPFLSDSINYFMSKGGREIVIAPAITYCEDWTPALRGELDRQFAEMYHRSLRHYELKGDIPVSLFRNGTSFTVKKPGGSSLCGVGRGISPAIDVDGQIYGCATFIESTQTFPTDLLKQELERLKIGNVSDPDLFSKLERFQELSRRTNILINKQDKYSSYGRCRDCPSFSNCAICPVSIGQIPGNSDPNRIPDFQCAFNLIALKYQKRFHIHSEGDAGVPEHDVLYDRIRDLKRRLAQWG